MPIAREIAEHNQSQRERMEALAAKLDERALKTRLPNGWTVAGAFAHLAFWDRQRMVILRRWAAGEECTGLYAGSVFNDAMQPLLERIPARESVAAALEAAEEVDALLLALPDSIIETALARADAPNVRRGQHREHHLDIIERALGEA
jgi:hypothetical protein